MRRSHLHDGDAFIFSVEVFVMHKKRQTTQYRLGCSGLFQKTLSCNISLDDVFFLIIIKHLAALRANGAALAACPVAVDDSENGDTVFFGSLEFPGQLLKCLFKFLILSLERLFLI